MWSWMRKRCCAMSRMSLPIGSGCCKCCARARSRTRPPPRPPSRLCCPPSSPPTPRPRRLSPHHRLVLERTPFCTADPLSHTHAHTLSFLSRSLSLSFKARWSQLKPRHRARSQVFASCFSALPAHKRISLSMLSISVVSRQRGMTKSASAAHTHTHTYTQSVLSVLDAQHDAQSTYLTLCSTVHSSSSQHSAQSTYLTVYFASSREICG
jgi:hypothetical protein